MIDVFPAQRHRRRVGLLVQCLFGIESAGAFLFVMDRLLVGELILDENLVPLELDEWVRQQVIPLCCGMFQILTGRHQLKDASDHPLSLSDGNISMRARLL